jgi:hypothetical protein
MNIRELAAAKLAAAFLRFLKAETAAILCFKALCLNLWIKGA